MVWGSIISGIAGIGGSLIGASSSRSNNRAIIANAALDREYQKEFAQQGIGWRVSDAKAAGIHPLYAMGANIPGYNPSPISLTGGGELGAGLASAGQDIGRAVSAGSTKSAREGSILYKLGVERAGLENELLKTQIQKIANPGATALPSAVDAMGPFPGQPDASIQVNPLQLNPSAINQPHMETGATSSAGFQRTATGLSIVPSLDAKERMEDQIGPELAWAIRNNIMPLINPSMMADPRRKPNPAQFPTYPGFEWVWVKSHQEYQQKRINRKSSVSRERAYPHNRPKYWGTHTGS